MSVFVTKNIVLSTKLNETKFLNGILEKYKI